MTRRILFFLLGVGLCCAFTETPALSAPLSQSQTTTLKKQLGENARLRIHHQTGLAHFLAPDEDRPSSAQREMNFSAMQASTPEAAARLHLAQYGRYFGVSDPDRDLLLEHQKTGGNGHQYLRYQQTYQGLPILAGELIVQLDGDKRLKSISGKAAPETTISITPGITAETAIQTAQQLAQKYYGLSAESLQNTTPELCLFNPGLWGRPDTGSRLAWKLEVAAESARVKELVLIDALSGAVLLHFNQIPDALSRLVYDGHNNFTKTLVGREGTPPPASNVEALNLFNYLGDTYTFYSSKHGRNSINNLGMTLLGTVNYCSPEYPADCPLQNAFWDGQQMLMGEGFVTDDIVAHEYTHGVTDYESKLFYYGESGAINEAFSDMWGEFVDQTNGRGNDAPAQRWLLGEDLQVGGIRNMSNPAAFSEPDRIGSANYVCTTDDNGGVHTNNGVNNKAITLIVDGGSFNGQTVTGLGINKVAKIYYEAQSNLLISGSDYGDLYTAVQQACTSLVGGTSGLTASDCIEIKKALDAVNMGTPPCATPADVPLCNAGFSPNNLFYDGFEVATTNWVSEDKGFWQVINEFAPAGTKSLVGTGTGDNYPTLEPSLSTKRMSVAKLLPANAYLRFYHAFNFENSGGTNYDGGVLRYSTDNGLTKKDAKDLFVANGYNGSLSTSVYHNPLPVGTPAFVGDRFRYTTSKLNLASLAGQSVKFYFTIGSDDWTSSNWAIDEVQIYTCKDSAPDHLVLQLNDGATYTTGQTVDLTLSAEDIGTSVTGMRFSNNNLTWSPWEAYATSRSSWLLTAGNGSKAVYAQFSDASGSVSASVKATIIYDSTPPTFTVATVTPKPAGTTTMTISGTREANAVMEIIGNATIGTLNTPTPTTWNCTLTELAPGNSTFVVTATDLAGNTALAKNIVVKIAPTIDLNQVTSPTKESSQSISGTVQPGCNVTLYKGTIKLGEDVNQDGSWNFTPNLVANSSNLFTVTAIDEYGNKTSKPVVIVCDTRPPAMAVTSVPVQPAGTTSLTIRGTREANAIVSITTDSTTTLGALNYPTTTTWNCLLTTIPPGNNTFAITATDLAGNPSLAKNLVVKVAPTIDLNQVTSPTKESSQTISGTVQPGCNVALYKGTIKLGEDVNQDGSWNFTPNLVANSSNLFSVTAIDEYGNKTSKPVAIVCDMRPPTFTVVAVPVQPAGTTSVKISGTREANATIAVTTDSGTPIDPVLYPTATTWSCVLRDPLPISSIFTVTATDLAKNFATKNIEVKVAPNLSVDPVTSPTRESSQLIGGSVQSGSSVALYKGTLKLGEDVDNDGIWSFTVNLVANSNNSLTVTATDSKGNKTSKPVVIVRDTLAPAFTIAAVSNPKPAGTTSLWINGSREANAVINVTSNSSTTIGAPVYLSTTTWKCPLTALPPASSSVFAVTATDLAGNTSLAKNVTVTVAP